MLIIKTSKSILEGPVIYRTQDDCEILSFRTNDSPPQKKIVFKYKNKTGKMIDWNRGPYSYIIGKEKKVNTNDTCQLRAPYRELYIGRLDRDNYESEYMALIGQNLQNIEEVTFETKQDDIASDLQQMLQDALLFNSSYMSFETLRDTECEIKIWKYYGNIYDYTMDHEDWQGSHFIKQQSVIKIKRTCIWNNETFIEELFPEININEFGNMYKYNHTDDLRISNIIKEFSKKSSLPEECERFANNITKETFTTKTDLKDDFILQFHNDGNELIKELINILVTKKYRCIVKGVLQEDIFCYDSLISWPYYK